MCALGQKQTFSDARRMSALPPKADIDFGKCHVRFAPKADIGPESRANRLNRRRSNMREARKTAKARAPQSADNGLRQVTPVLASNFSLVDCHMK
jgi:hypothetical protein